MTDLEHLIQDLEHMQHGYASTSTCYQLLAHVLVLARGIRP
jgi:hypothetical protein